MGNFPAFWCGLNKKTKNIANKYRFDSSKFIMKLTADEDLSMWSYFIDTYIHWTPQGISHHKRHLADIFRHLAEFQFEYRNRNHLILANWMPFPVKISKISPIFRRIETETRISILFIHRIIIIIIIILIENKQFQTNSKVEILSNSVYYSISRTIACTFDKL